MILLDLCAIFCLQYENSQSGVVNCLPYILFFVTEFDKANLRSVKGSVRIQQGTPKVDLRFLNSDEA